MIYLFKRIDIQTFTPTFVGQEFLSSPTHTNHSQPVMSSIDFGAKITGYEAKEWIRNILGDAEEGRIYDEEDFMTLLVKHKPVDFKAPRKSRASKVSSSDRSDAEYDCQLCDARVWNADPDTKKGLGGQCSRLKKDDECLCVIHIKESGKHDGLLRNGYINGPRPVHAYGDETQQVLPWHDVELPDKPVKKTSSGAKGGKRKCSNCGETGHNKKTCSLLKENKVVEEVKVVLDEIVDCLCAEEETVEDAPEPEPEDEPEPEPEDEDETEDENEPEPEDEPEEVVEEVVAPVVPKKVAKKEVPKKEVQKKAVPKKEDQKKAVAKKVAKKEEPVEEESLVTEDTELDEDESGNIVFEGIEYTLDSEENEVYDDELSVVGTWCPDTETVAFINPTEEKLHRVRKLGLKKQD